MIVDEVSLYNLALNAVGKRDNLSAITERDRGAEVCNLWYPVVRDAILEAAPWPSTRSIRRLAQLSIQGTEGWEPGAPEPGYGYAFALPEDCLRPRFISTYQRFIITQGADPVKILMTDTPDVILTYTSRQTMVSQWENSLGLAIVYGLAAHICMPLTGKAQRANFLIQQANQLVMQARESTANFDDSTVESIPDWFVARGFFIPSVTRYFYPNGNLLGLADVN